MMDGVVLHPAITKIASAALGPAPRADADHPVGRNVHAELLSGLVRRLGPDGLLSAGRYLDVVASEPIVLALLNSDSPTLLLGKIERLNRYLHSHHRHHVLELDAGHVELEHRSTGATPPAPVESLFVCGLYLELLSRIGCRRISCAFPDAETGNRDVYRDGRPKGVPDDHTARWSIGWTSFEPARTLPRLDEVLLRELPTDLADGSLSAHVEAVVRNDLSRSWRLASEASQLVVSPRTLQRRLRHEGRSFSEIVRAVRLTAAQDLLGDPARTVTDIGYLTGFADTAHFTRTFKDDFGTTPTDWRRAHAGAR